MRFPEFIDEWETRKLGNLCKVYDGTHQTPNYVESGIPFYSVEHVTSNNFDKTKYISEEVYNKEIKRVKLEKGDILMTRIGDIGTSKYIDWEVKASFYVSLALIKQSETINSKYLNQFILTAYFQKELWHRTIHVAFPKKINLGEINNCLVNFPCTSEQEKISSLLILIDKRIQAQNKILQSYQTLRQSIKERILTQKIRFKDSFGNCFPDWKKIKLEELCEKQSSNISANKIEDNFGEFPIYGATGVLKNVDFYEVETEYIAIIKDGAGVGRLFLCEQKSSVLGTLDIIKPKNINLYFLYCLLSNIDFNKYTTGSTIPHIYFKDYKNEFCMIPCEEEQTKIASFLSSIDERIKTEKEILKQFENQKKYLLQNMFV